MGALSNMAGQHLIIFVKAPRPGMVKTRLAATLGDGPAADAYRRITRTLLDHLESLANVELRYAPDDALAEIRPWLRAGWSARQQGPGDLGRRLVEAFADAFNRGADRSVIIGSDCPWIEPSDIENAWSHLNSFDVVLGPATDGGYWLIGLHKPQPEIFDGIQWSTESVLRQTLDRIRQAKLSSHMLRTLRDIDTSADWHEFLTNC